MQGLHEACNDLGAVGPKLLKKKRRKLVTLRVLVRTTNGLAGARALCGVAKNIF